MLENNNEQSSFQQDTPNAQNSLDASSELVAQPELQIERRKKRKNGFSWPCHYAQFTLLLPIGMNVSIFFLYLIDYIIIKVNPLEYQIDILAVILSIISAIAIIFSLIHGIRATKINPEDRLIKIQEECNRMNQSFQDEGKYEYYCNICCMFVNEGSKHCKTCNKCIEQFDHHCFWLNNCIGGNNYKHFFRLLSFALLAFVSMIGMQVKCILNINEQWQDRNQMIQIGDQLQSKQLQILDHEQMRDSDRIYFIILIITLTINILASLPLCQLFNFHLKLKRLNMSTFEYLKQQDSVPYKSKVTVKI